MMIIIDAYNVLQHIAKGRAGQSEKDAFTAQIQDYADRTGHQISLIFDGGSVLVPARQKQGKLVIIHTGHRETADDYIIRLLEYESGGKVLLVSSDRQLQSAARRWGAEYMETSVFVGLFQEPEVAVKPGNVKGKQLIKRAGTTVNEELAQLMEQESRSLPVKQEEPERPWKEDKMESKKDKRLRRTIKKL
jgi:predicted RNA-binding protein with PIN domain